MLSSSPSPLVQIPLKSTSSGPRRTYCRQLSISNSATAYKERPNLSFASERTATSTCLYDILGISTAASYQEIKSAYRQLARTCHPDVASCDRKDTSAGEFMKIHEAYSTLSDPHKRAVYDSKLFTRNRPLTVTFSGYSSGRSWETDQCW
ncbi:Chaperone DnaJ-domain superfamily protein [Euphorbia peplus]|nr:Chaperone DnaJ-domain superfamily protein [Euphorbia peplus]